MAIFDMGTGLSSMTTGLNQVVTAVNTVSSSAANIANTVGNLSNVTSVASAINAVSNVVGSVRNIANAVGVLTDPTKFASTLRSVNLPIGGEMSIGTGGATARFSGGADGSDWRVSIRSAAGGFTFPFTPTISINGSAQYDEQVITHQNYPFMFFVAGRGEQIQISGAFNVDNTADAARWLEALRFLRASIKMFQSGNPPLICKLNGYGNYVFKNIPVIVKGFSVDLPADVHYISAGGGSMVPVKSNFNVTLQPVYSRDAAMAFSLGAMIAGAYPGKYV